MKRHYSRLLCGAAAIAIMSSAGMAQAEERAQVRFDIPAQPLTAALNQFGIQSGSAVLFKADVTGAKVSKPLTGAADPEMALAMMLDGTGLSYRREGQAFVIVSASDPQSASAAGDGADAGTVQALIVTAQKREENIQDVPIAMSAFTQEDLTRSQVAGGPDLMTQVPNMTFTKTNFTGYSIQIRGIGTQAISATTDPAVAVAFNNTPFVRNRFFEQEFYDLQRVEVLRGPQGTLYGRNATAGVVNILSAKPKFIYEAKVSADVASYQSTRLEGMVNVPLVEDAVALRLAGAWTKRDGYATNQMTGNPIDGRDLWSTRLSLRIAPSDAFDANLIWEHFEESDDRLRSGKQLCKKDLRPELNGFPIPPASQGITEPGSVLTQGCAPVSLYSDEAFQTPNGDALPYYLPLGDLGLPVFFGLDPYLSATQSHDLRVIESSIDPKYRAKNDLVELQVSADLSDHLTLSSETGYSSDFLWSMEDYNRFTTTPHAFSDTRPYPEGLLQNGFFCDPQLGCSDRVLAADVSTAKSRQFSQEFRLSSNFDGSFNFNLGANFLRYDTEDKYYVFINTLTLVSAQRNVNRAPPPWIPGATDNHDCLDKLQFGDATEAQQLGLTNCWYIDPSPIESVNDLGHNYFLSKNPYKLISYAAFGEAYYQVAPNLKVTAGLRWTVDRKEAPEIPSWLLAPGNLGYPVLSVVKQEWREPTGRLAIDWKPNLAFTDETLFYASYAHGYKAGGANPPPSTVVTYLPDGADVLVHDSLTHPKTFEPEFVNAFEIGSKNTLLGGRMTLNVSGFYYDYTGYQISEIVDRAAINHNYDADVWGAEIEADWRPIENLHLSFKGGYEKTRVADGMQGIDLMDRTAGHQGWVVARSFPTVPSNCILPDYVFIRRDGVYVPGVGFPNAGPCIAAYQEGLDPVTLFDYVANPQVGDLGISGTGVDPLAGTPYEGYVGFDPKSAPNNGEGFFKNLSGNELPNAPRFTATVTADYTLPLANDWLMTLHTDLYWQDKAWARIFNYDPYDRIKPYTNVNFAAIFANEPAGWQVMAYVKNVFDKDNITGAFLNSDDTGLTTNVFLSEPRIYGLKITKQWRDLPWSLGRSHVGPYPFAVEVGGAILRQDAPVDPVSDSTIAVFSPVLAPAAMQHHDLDWGDGREVRLTYAPGGSWRVSVGGRFGKSNTASHGVFADPLGGRVCPTIQIACDTIPDYFKYPANTSIVRASQRDDHTLIDFTVGKDLGLGRLSESGVSAGLRYARLTSRSQLGVRGVPDWDMPASSTSKYDTSTHHWIDASLTASRKFEGAGPIVSWQAAKAILGQTDGGHLDLTWSLGAGVLFGRQTAAVDGEALNNSYIGRYANVTYPPILLDSDTTPVHRRRSKSVSVPTANVSLGLAYSIDRFTVGAGYRWERYFDVIDVGAQQRRAEDRTFDGPYLRIAVGFGG